MENQIKLVFILLLTLGINCCKYKNTSSEVNSKNEYLHIKDIVYKSHNGNYFFRYSFSKRNGREIVNTFAFEEEVRNLNTDSIYKLKDVIDIKTFKKLEFSYYMDKQNVYVKNQYAGHPNFSYFPLNSSQVEIVDEYLINDEDVYYFSKKIATENASEFHTKLFITKDLPISLGFDENSIFLGEEKLTSHDFLKLNINMVQRDSLFELYFTRNEHF